MPTRYARRRVFISYSGEEEPVEAIILNSIDDEGATYLRIKHVDTGIIFDVQVGSINWIAHKKSKVVRLPKIKLVEK